MSAPELFHYGIHNEGTDIRAHVAIYAKKLYCFPTRPALKVMTKFPKKPAFQDGVEGPTAEGHVVPVSAIPHIRYVTLADDRVKGFRESWNPSQKGAFAVDIVRAVLKAGRFPIWFDGELVDELDMQVNGVDISIRGRWRIQVKCDKKAGNGDDPRCSGNLYLQIAERNPLHYI